MPALIPTADDLARMTPSQRAKIRRFIAQVALELDEHARDLVDTRAAERQLREQQSGERIRQHARNLQAQLPPEPAHITAARRQTLLDNTR
jgi:hypothetical protein